jgi:hypothetical protein
MISLKMVRRILAQKSTAYIFIRPMGYSFFIDLNLVLSVERVLGLPISLCSKER